MKNNDEKQNYLAPECEQVEFKLEGVIAASGLTDYGDGGTF